VVSSSCRKALSKPLLYFVLSTKSAGSFLSSLASQANWMPMDFSVEVEVKAVKENLFPESRYSL